MYDSANSSNDLRIVTEKKLVSLRTAEARNRSFLLSRINGHSASLFIEGCVNVKSQKRTSTFSYFCKKF